MADIKISEFDLYNPPAGLIGTEIVPIVVDEGVPPLVDLKNKKITIAQISGGNNAGLKTLTTAAGSAGFVSEFRSADPTYPYLGENIDFTITAISPTILRIGDTGPVIFTDADDYYDVSKPIVTEFPSFDIDVTTIPGVPVGNHTYYIYIRKDGSYIVINSVITDDPEICRLGSIVLTNDGANTTINTVSTMGIVVRPNFYRNNTLYNNQQSTLFQGSIVAQPDLGLHIGKCIIRGESIDFPLIPINARDVPATANNQFIYATPKILDQVVLPAPVALFDPNNYWNGVALVVIPDNPPTIPPVQYFEPATVQRILMNIRGGLVIQYGSVVYPDLDTATASISTEAFNATFTSDYWGEIARVAICKNATALSNASMAKVLNTSEIGGYQSSSAAPAVNQIFGTANQVIADSPIGSVTLSLPQDIGITSSPTFKNPTVSEFPTDVLHAVNQQYLLDVMSGTNQKGVAVAVSTADAVNGLIIADDVQLVENDLVLRNSATRPELNGFYVAHAGAWVRHIAMDQYDECPNAQVSVSGGTVYTGTRWFCTSPVVGVIDVDPINWLQLSTGGLPEAPMDGSIYGRRNAVWTDVNGATAFKLPAVCATISNLVGCVFNAATNTLTGPREILNMDGISPAVGDRVLVKNQTPPAHNGVYVVTILGTAAVNWEMRRTSDCDTAMKLASANIPILMGNVQGGTSWSTSFKGTNVLNGTSMYWMRQSGSAHFQLWRNAGIQVANGATLDVPWGRADIDPYESWNAAAPTAVTIPFTGMWNFSGNLTLSNLGAWNVGVREVWVSVPGRGNCAKLVYYAPMGEPSNAQRVELHFSGQAWCNAGDAIIVKFWQNSGGNISIGPEVGSNQYFIGCLM